MSLQGSFPPVNLPPGVFPAAEYAELLLESARFQLHNLQSCYWKAHVSSCCICRAVTGRRNFQLQNMPSCCRKAHVSSCRIYAELLPKSACLQLQNMQSCCQNAHVCSFKGRIVVGKWLFATANLSIIMFCRPVQLCDALNALLETEL